MVDVTPYWTGRRKTPPLLPLRVVTQFYYRMYSYVLISWLYDLNKTKMRFLINLYEYCVLSVSDENSEFLSLIFESFVWNRNSWPIHPSCPSSYSKIGSRQKQDDGHSGQVDNNNKKRVPLGHGLRRRWLVSVTYIDTKPLERRTLLYFFSVRNNDTDAHNDRPDRQRQN